MEQERTLAPAKKSPIDIDLREGVKPRNYSELMQFAALYKASRLAPKSFETTEQLAIAIAMCLEVGRPIITGVGDMAVINGRVGIYGDAALAMVRASGELENFEEWSEGTPYTDDWTFYCKIKRKGYPEKVDSWSWADAKRAGLDDPKKRDGSKDPYSPWRRFPKRMMQFKARNFVLRDMFGDILRGMKTVEDLQDIIDVTPKSETIPTPAQPQAKVDGDIYKATEVPRQEPAPEEEPVLEKEPVPEKEAVPEKAASEEDKEAFEKGAFRNEWINTRKAGFATYVYKNTKKIKEIEDRWPDVIEEMRQKWDKLYDRPWPLDQVEEPSAPEPEPKLPTTPIQEGGKTYLYCPVTSTRKNIVVCATRCDRGMKKTCSTYNTYLKDIEAQKEKEPEVAPHPPAPWEEPKAEGEVKSAPQDFDREIPCPERGDFPTAMSFCAAECPKTSDGTCEVYNKAVAEETSSNGI